MSDIRNEETGEKLLFKRFDKISFVGSDVALARYLNPSSVQVSKRGHEYIPIFPFGCNNSQYKAVKNAMENQIRLKVITYDDLSDFSNELQMEVKRILEMSR